MRLSAGNFTTNWARFGVGSVDGCAFSVVLLRLAYSYFINLCSYVYDFCLVHTCFRYRPCPKRDLICLGNLCQWRQNRSRTWGHKFINQHTPCDGNEIKINRREGDGNETTIEGIHRQYYCSGEEYWWCKMCVEEIRWIDNLGRNEILKQKI